LTRWSKPRQLSRATNAQRNGNQQRSYRDMQAAVAHFMTGKESIIDPGSIVAGAPGSVPEL